MIPNRLRLLLGSVIFAVLAGSFLIAVFVSRRAVDAADRDLLRAETAVGAALWKETGGGAVLDRIFPGRWHFAEELDPTIDEAIVLEHTHGPIGRAAVYDADSWDRLGTLSLTEDPLRPTRRPRIRWLLLLATLSSLVVVSWLWIGIEKKRALPPLIALALLLTASWIRWRDETRTLEDMSAVRLALAEKALAAVPDVETLLARPGGVYTLTELAFVLRDRSGDVEFSSLPPAATEELERIDPPVHGRFVADRIEYSVTDVNRVRLVLLPYQASYGSGALGFALTFLGVLAASLPAWLTRLVHQPLVLRAQWTAWSFLAPSFLSLAVFTVGPLLFAAWLSLHRWSLLDVARPFVGMDNYVRLLQDSSWWNAVLNTVVFTLHVPVAMAAALGLALLVQRPRRGVVWLRTALFLPGITSLVAVAIAWQWMLHDEYGLINWTLSWVGIGPVPWLTSTKTALVAIMMLSIWMVVGYQIVLFQAGLAAIPRELYDAARIDGAGPWRRFVHVTLPGLRHTLFFVLVTSVIGSFQVFGAVYVMTEGGPLHATDVAVFHIYEEAWEFFRFGDAAAMSWVLFIIVFVFSWLQFRFLERKVEEGG